MCATQSRSPTSNFQPRYIRRPQQAGEIERELCDKPSSPCLSRSCWNETLGRLASPKQPHQHVNVRVASQPRLQQQVVQDWFGCQHCKPNFLETRKGHTQEASYPCFSYRPICFRICLGFSSRSQPGSDDDAPHYIAPAIHCAQQKEHANRHQI